MKNCLVAAELFLRRHFRDLIIRFLRAFQPILAANG